MDIRLFVLKHSVMTLMIFEDAYVRIGEESNNFLLTFTLDMDNGRTNMRRIKIVGEVRGQFRKHTSISSHESPVIFNLIGFILSASDSFKFDLPGVLKAIRRKVTLKTTFLSSKGEDDVLMKTSLPKSL